MKKIFLSILNNMVAGSAFVVATFISTHSMIWGVIGYVIAYMYLDLHSYFDKKLNYPNNLFI